MRNSRIGLYSLFFLLGLQACGGGGGGGSSNDDAATTTFRLRIENISANKELETAFSPGIWITHDLAGQSLFTDPQVANTPGLEQLAEDGDPTMLATTVAGFTGFRDSGTFDTPVGAASAAAINPGEYYEFTFSAVPSTRLAFASMLVDSNDLLVAPDTSGIELFDGSGTALPARDITDQVLLWDVGSESNQAFAQGTNQPANTGAANTGPSELPGVLIRNDSTRAMPLARSMMRVAVSRGDGSVQPEDQFTITFENVSAQTGTLVTQFGGMVWATHSDNFSLFSPGNSAGVAGFEDLVEQGDPSTIEMTLAAVADVGSSGSTVLIGTGASVDVVVTPTVDERYFSFASMIVASNDAFIAPTANGVALLDASGSPRAAEVVEAEIMASLTVWDAGTEVNQTPGLGADQPLLSLVGAGAADPDDTVRRYQDLTNDLAGPGAGGLVSIMVSESGGDFTVTVENTATDNLLGVITPLVYVLHPTGTNVFSSGGPASSGLEQLAEDGDPTTLATEWSAIGMAGTAGSPISASQSFNFVVTPDATNRFLSLAAMVMPSNDTFLAFAPGGIALADASGTPRSVATINAEIADALSAWDAGTEANQAGGVGGDMPTVLGLLHNIGENEGPGQIRQAVNNTIWGIPDIGNLIRITIEPE